MSWDDPMPDPIAVKRKRIIDSIICFENISIPRNIKMCDFEIHFFAMRPASHMLQSSIAFLVVMHKYNSCKNQRRAN